MDELVQRARQRDADAFTQLMQSQMQHMYKTARTVLYNEEDIADAISDTILACWEKLGQLKDNTYFRTWMTRILINKCNDILRKNRRLCITDQVPEAAAKESGYEDLEWQDAFSHLDERYRLVLMLYYVEGFKTSEISKILKCPESTVRSQLARGRERLAKLYPVNL